MHKLCVYGMYHHIERKCNPGVPHTSQTWYHIVVDFTHWPELIPYNKYNIIAIINKNKYSEDSDDIHRVVLDFSSENIKSLVQRVRTLWCHQYNRSNHNGILFCQVHLIHVKIIGGQHNKWSVAQISMTYSKNIMFKKYARQHKLVLVTFEASTSFNLSACMIVHPCMDISVVTYVENIPINFFNRKQPKINTKTYIIYHWCIS